MARRDRWKTLAVVGVVLIEPAFVVWHAGTPGATGVYIPPPVGLALAGLVLTGMAWWVLRRDGGDGE